MAVTATIGNECKELMASAVIDYSSDTFKGILMADGFAYDRANDDAYADVSANELAAGAGYSTGGITLTGVTITRNDTTNKVTISWNNASWLAAGGDIEAVGLLIFDDTVASPTVDPVIGYINFGELRIAYDTGNFVVTNIEIEM
jgi:hypothetical protein